MSRTLVTPKGIENVTSFPHLRTLQPYKVDSVGHLIALSKLVLFNSTSLDRPAPRLGAYQHPRYMSESSYTTQPRAAVSFEQRKGNAMLWRTVHFKSYIFGCLTHE